MAEKMHRAQILLEPRQHKTLAEIARQNDRSISDVVRQIISEWLNNQEYSVLWERRTKASNDLKAIRENIEQQYGVIQDNLIEDGRQERELDLN